MAGTIEHGRRTNENGSTLSFEVPGKYRVFREHEPNTNRLSFSSGPSIRYDLMGLPAQQPHQEPGGAARDRSERRTFLTTDGSADCRRDACGCRYQKSFSFPGSAFPAAPQHDPCVHMHL